MTLLVALVVGFLVGIVICYFIARRGFEERVRQQFGIMRQRGMSDPGDRPGQQVRPQA